eukprot:gnl/MRDRNA2_/MRDRNA2_27126_c0_seq1.p1 gnl/MRDRNA2_/MRDRNA2_27126_c0~~gnl/MRDRNA2_/MRDRNA2_27126_c0_seq1.p1  ORF type:complete len:186 (-),score=26.56 gnl/MRDRNA2_/MRDRNA2_27126_c0_seq1:160-717(-)
MPGAEGLQEQRPDIDEWEPMASKPTTVAACGRKINNVLSGTFTRGFNVEDVKRHCDAHRRLFDSTCPKEALKHIEFKASSPRLVRPDHHATGLYKSDKFSDSCKNFSPRSLNFWRQGHAHRIEHHIEPTQYRKVDLASQTHWGRWVADPPFKVGRNHLSFEPERSSLVGKPAWAGMSREIADLLP